MFRFDSGLKGLNSVSYPGVGKATAGVEGWQQSEAHIFGHMQELILVPLHVLTCLLQHYRHGVPTQQTSKDIHAQTQN